MDVTNVHEDGCVDPGRLPVVAAVNDAAVKRERPRWHASAAIYSFSFVLALVTAVLCLKGPLQGLGPLRDVIPQGEMFAVVCVLSAIADWVPVSLHYRGNTFLWVLEDIPLLIGLVFLSPNLLVLSTVCAVAFVFLVLRRQAMLKVTFNVASTALVTALAAVVFRELLGTHSPVSLVGLGRRGRGPDFRPDRGGPRIAGRHAACRPDRKEAGGNPSAGDPRDADGGEHVPRVGVPRRRLVRPVDDSAPPPRRRPDHRGLPGLHAASRSASRRCSISTTSAGRWARPASSRRP